LATWPDAPVLNTEQLGSVRARVLRTRVRAPDGLVYGLLLARDMADIDAVVGRFRLAAGLSTAVAALILVFVQLWQGRRLQQRLDRLGAHMRRLEAGRLQEDPPADDTGDEISRLRDMIAGATTQLRAARAGRDRLIADAAHELRTPLAALRMEIDLALRRERPVDELRRTLAHVRAEGDRLSTLTERLLDLAALRATPLQRAPVHIPEVLDAVAARARSAADERGLQISVNAAAETVQGAYDELERAVDNLLANALAHSPDGGRIDLSARRHGDELAISVQDEGPGIRHHDPAALFSAFARGDRKRPGAGLGLAIVADIATRHGGHAAFDTTVPLGARVVLTLPLSPPPMSQPPTM